MTSHERIITCIHRSSATSHLVAPYIKRDLNFFNSTEMLHTLICESLLWIYRSKFPSCDFRHFQWETVKRCSIVTFGPHLFIKSKKSATMESGSIGARERLLSRSICRVWNIVHGKRKSKVFPLQYLSSFCLQSFTSLRSASSPSPFLSRFTSIHYAFHQ